MPGSGVCWRFARQSVRAAGTDAYPCYMSEDWRVQAVSELRTLICTAVPDVVEEVKWRKPTNPDGVPAFSRDGLICTVETYKDKVKVTFAKGASLADPENVFNASLDAGTRRAVDITDVAALDARAFQELVRQAAELNSQ